MQKEAFASVRDFISITACISDQMRSLPRGEQQLSSNLIWILLKMIRRYPCRIWKRNTNLKLIMNKNLFKKPDKKIII